MREATGGQNGAKKTRWCYVTHGFDITPDIDGPGVAQGTDAETRLTLFLSTEDSGITSLKPEPIPEQIVVRPRSCYYGHENEIEKNQRGKGVAQTISLASCKTF